MGYYACIAEKLQSFLKAKEIDGVCVPITRKQLEEKNITKSLEQLKPRNMLEELGRYAKILSK